MTLLSLATLVALGAGVAYLDTYMPRLVEAEIALKGLPAPVEVLFAADIHSRRFGPEQQRLGRLLGERRFDAIVLGGDYVGTRSRLTGAQDADSSRDPDPAYELLALLEKRTDRPVLFVRGNHDDETVLRGLASRGAEELRTDADVSGLSFVLDESLVTAGRPSVLVRHIPPGQGDLEAARRAGVGAVLSAHTHGGQIALPLIGPVWAPLSPEAPAGGWFPGINGQQTSGVRDHGGVQVLITRGLGTMDIPVRAFSRAEMVAITFVPQP